MANNKEESKLFVHIIKRSEINYELAGLSEDKQLWCTLPVEHQNLKDHKTLFSKPTIKNAVSAIKPINGFRKIGIKIDESLKKEYFDEDDNLCYMNIPLEELNSINKTEEENFLITKIKELETKLNLNNDVKLHEIEKKFILDKFDKKQNPTEWLEQYENECTRHKVNNATKMIETLRFFVIGSPKDWYEANLKKIGLINWPEWRKSFLTVFVDKGWSKIRKAYNYKHLGGSLIDYALTKERLCLEVEKNSTISSRINMIVVGLPLEVQDELDREEITTFEKLFTELRKLDDSFSKIKKNLTTNFYNNANKKTDKPKDKYDDQKNKSNDTFKKPCFMCEALGWRNRYHPTNECRNKKLYMDKKKVNLIEARFDNDTDDVAAEMMKIEIDNKSLN